MSMYLTAMPLLEIKLMLRTAQALTHIIITIGYSRHSQVAVRLVRPAVVHYHLQVAHHQAVVQAHRQVFPQARFQAAQVAAHQVVHQAFHQAVLVAVRQVVLAVVQAVFPQALLAVAPKARIHAQAQAFQVQALQRLEAIHRHRLLLAQYCLHPKLMRKTIRLIQQAIRDIFLTAGSTLKTKP